MICYVECELPNSYPPSGDLHTGQRGSDNLRNLGQRVKSAIRRLGSQDAADPDNQTTDAPEPPYHKMPLRQVEAELQQKELQRTRLALEVAHARYFDLLAYTSTLYDQAPVGYLTLTPEGVIVEADLTVAKLLTVTRELLLQHPISHFIVAADRDLFNTYCKQLLATQNSQRCELRMVCADGSHFFAQMDASIIEDILGADIGVDALNTLRGSEYIRITIIDVSARVQLEVEERKVRSQLETTLVDLRQTQAQMVKQERLAVVGQLAAGIAHDFNNILAAITLYAQIVFRASTLPDQLRTRMEVIVVQASRATDLVQQILDFSRRTIISRQSTSLSNYLQELVELLRHTLPETIQISLEIDLPQAGVNDIVDIDPSRMQQVMLNLAFNARDAMPEGGNLRIHLSRIVTDDSFPAPASGTLSPGPWLRILVSDTGTGIEPIHLPNLFEPFFTTKKVGAGSGLGLAQVLGIVKQHEGEIGITSQVGMGTAISLYLPAASEEPSLPPPSELEELAHGHGELVLVVEDNNVLRTALVTALEQLDYQVLTATDGQDAAFLMTQKGDQVKLIMSDLVMPVMSGEGFIRTLRTQGWEQPMVVLSGHALPADKLEQLHRFGKISWLPKPPTLVQLAVALQQALQPSLEEKSDITRS